MCLHLCAIISCTQYFDKRRSFATSACATGTGVGVLLWPPLTYYLDIHYGWKGALLIEGAIFLNGAICGALLRPFTTDNTLQKTEEKLTFKTICPILRICQDKSDDVPSKTQSFTSFYVYLSGICLLYFGHMTMIVYTPLRMSMAGFSIQKGALLVSLIGFLALTRFIFGWLGDQKWVNRIILLGISTLLAGVFMVSTVFTTDFLTLAIIQGCFGLASGKILCLLLLVFLSIAGYNVVYRFPSQSIHYKNNYPTICFDLFVSMHLLHTLHYFPD